MSIGIKYVKRAGQWVFYKCFNNTKSTDIFEWFNTEREAKERLEGENGIV